MPALFPGAPGIAGAPSLQDASVCFPQGRAGRSWPGKCGAWLLRSEESLAKRRVLSDLALNEFARPCGAGEAM